MAWLSWAGLTLGLDGLSGDAIGSAGLQDAAAKKATTSALEKKFVEKTVLGVVMATGAGGGGDGQRGAGARGRAGALHLRWVQAYVPGAATRCDGLAAAVPAVSGRRRAGAAAEAGAVGCGYFGGGSRYHARCLVRDSPTMTSHEAAN